MHLCKQINVRYFQTPSLRYYKLAGEKELEMFLTDAIRYVSPSAPHMLPDQLPKYVTPAEVKHMFPKELAFKGYCPVTYVVGNMR